jgi:hypothetical protein
MPGSRHTRGEFQSEVKRFPMALEALEQRALMAILDGGLGPEPFPSPPGPPVVQPPHGSNQASARVYAPHAKARGGTMAEWSAAWWKWALGKRVSKSPLFDETGANADVGNKGKVYFLAGVVNTSGKVERTVTMPAGTPIFFPVVSTSADNSGVPPTHKSVKRLRSEAAASVDSTTNVYATVDGLAVQDVQAHRERSPVFSYTLPATGNISQHFGVDVSGRVGGAVSDGYWVMLKPLSPGQHTVRFGGTFQNTGFKLDVTYHVTVEPKGVAVTGGSSAASGKRVGRDFRPAQVLESASAGVL